tara:strand:- start:722 stop:838 length:117 start_codon:yes stop_codon:yes gene_type:complete
MWNDIATIIVFNWIPVSMIVIASLLFVELVKYEHRRKK